MYRLVRESSGNKKTSFSTAGFEPSIANFFSNFFVFFAFRAILDEMCAVVLKTLDLRNNNDNNCPGGVA
jgi:hypothetical protein